MEFAPMNPPKFYLLSVRTPSSNQYVITADKYPVGLTEEMISYVRTDKYPTTPIKVVIKNRKKVDIMYGLDSFFFNDRVLNIFKENALTGWAVFPVEVTSPIGWQTVLHGLAIKGRTGPTPGQSLFEIDQWDGSDFFTFPRGYSVIVTERVIAAIESFKITGVYWELVHAMKNGEWL